MGHVAIWNGKQWVPEYKRKSIYIDDDYKSLHQTENCSLA